MKKLWILLCMIVSLLCVNKQVYAASANPNLTVSTVSAEPGSTVEVQIIQESVGRHLVFLMMKN